MVAERLKRVYRKTILKAAWPHYIQSLKKVETEEREKKIIADSHQTSDDNNDPAKNLANLSI